MKTIGIQIKRFPYEEPYLLNLALSASNGYFEGYLEYYCNAIDLKKFGKVMRTFPKKVPDDYFYEIGSIQPENIFSYYFALHAFTTDRIGHCAIGITIENNMPKPDKASCHFSIKAEPLAINRFGKLLENFMKLRHYALIWSVSGEADCLIETEKEFTEQHALLGLAENHTSR